MYKKFWSDFVRFSLARKYTSAAACGMVGWYLDETPAYIKNKP
jgi:hypothetical protein